MKSLVVASLISILLIAATYKAPSKLLSEKNVVVVAKQDRNQILYYSDGSSQPVDAVTYSKTNIGDYANPILL